jgi:hypothetical protein
MPTNDQILRDQLLEFLRGASAHADFDAAVKDFPDKHYGTKPHGAPYSAWQLLDHIRFTLRDLLDFSTNPNYLTPEWPAGYWPKSEAPASPQEWKASVESVKKDMSEFEQLIADEKSNLYAKIPWGEGQTLLREILLAGDHNSYHLGQIVLIRKQLDSWKD